ncbi:MAG: hypothetical protein Kow0090_19880 [Myxococcota bacterium]
MNDKSPIVSAFTKEGLLSELGIRLLVAVETEANIYQITRVTGLSSYLYLDALNELVEKEFIARFEKGEEKFSITSAGRDALAKQV